MKSMTIILPCYNEGRSIPLLLEKIQLANSNIKFILLNNGSFDNTNDVLNKIKIPKNVIVLKKKRIMDMVLG